MPDADKSLISLLQEGRSHFAWTDRPVPRALLVRLYELARLGPTSTNCNPARLVFLTTPAARARLLPALAEGNRAKTAAAPVTVILAWDTGFADHLPQLFPHRPETAGVFRADPALSEATAFRNSSLQGGYLILTARALGLDCGPMSGFDAAQLNAEFFPDGRWRANFLLNLGYGDASALFPRQPRLDFDTACRIL